MASWDAADLLLRLKDLLLRPEEDTVFTDDRLYRYLTMAEAFWKPQIATHFPNLMFTDRALCTTTDSKFYTWPGAAVNPLAVEVYESLTGEPLKYGAPWDPGSDYEIESTGFRITAGRERSFSDGPYARLITQPGDIDASTDSTIQPGRLRELLVWRAAAIAARAGAGIGDPSYFEEMADELAWGNPQLGTIGLIGQLKTTDKNWGQAAVISQDPYRWWRPNG